MPKARPARGGTAPPTDPASSPSIPPMIEFFAAQLEASRTDAAVDAAQEIMFDAWEAGDRRRRVTLAKKALKVSPDCADAYVLLAGEDATTPEEALELYRRGVEAGERALGKAAFEEDVGHFWGLLETRPYMRARQGFARALWDSGRREEAVGHYEDMLRLNPNDNQGIRYILIDALLELGLDAGAAKLLKTYKDDASGAWAWSTALLAYRQKGDTAQSRRMLARAVEANPHVPSYLTGKAALPKEFPDYISFGDEDEAVAYVHDARAAWAVAVGAQAWVASTLPDGAVAAGPGGPASPNDRAEDAEAERVDQAVLALLLLGLHDGDRAWKSFDWEAMNRLHAKGLISNPASRAKSVVFTPEGRRLAEAMYEALFARTAVSNTPDDA